MRKQVLVVAASRASFKIFLKRHSIVQKTSEKFKLVSSKDCIHNATNQIVVFLDGYGKNPRNKEYRNLVRHRRDLIALREF